MEKKLLREKKLVRKVMVISRPPVTFLLNLLFNLYTVHTACFSPTCALYPHLMFGLQSFTGAKEKRNDLSS